MKAGILASEERLLPSGRQQCRPFGRNDNLGLKAEVEERFRGCGTAPKPGKMSGRKIKKAALRRRQPAVLPDISLAEIEEKSSGILEKDAKAFQNLTLRLVTYSFSEA